MKRIPKMRNKRCSHCGREYALWLSCLAMSHRVARRLVRCWLLTWGVLLATGVGLLVGFIVRWHNAQPF